MAVKLSKRIITIKALDLIKVYCSPLEKMGFVRFNHDITFGQGKVSMLTNREESFLAYYQKELPMICSNENGRTLEQGFYISQFLIQHDAACSAIIPKMHAKFGYRNSLYIIEKEAHCQHMFTLNTQLDDVSFTQLIINRIHELKDYIFRYKLLAKHIIEEAKKPENHITLPYSTQTINNPILLENEYQVEKKARKNLILLHQDVPVEVTLTVRQQQCFSLLKKGFSSKEIARQLNLSYRTVEHYIEKIKMLLNCRNSKELIANYDIK